MARYQQGDRVYIVENNVRIRECRVLRYTGMVQVQIGDDAAVNLRYKETRLYQ